MRKKYVLASRNMDDIECGCEGEGILRAQNARGESRVARMHPRKQGQTGQDGYAEYEVPAEYAVSAERMSVTSSEPFELGSENRKHGKLREMFDVIVDLGLKQILPMFMVFAGIGYLINRFIPAAWIQMLLGADKWYSIPLAALIGLPMYVSGDGSIPLIRSLLDSGAGAGAIMAFMITGPGTSAGVIAGIGTILKGRAILLYTSLILVGGMLSGFIYQLL